MGKGTFKAYQKGKRGRDAIGAWGFVTSPLAQQRCSSPRRRGNLIAYRITIKLIKNAPLPMREGWWEGHMTVNLF